MDFGQFFPENFNKKSWIFKKFDQKIYKNSQFLWKFPRLERFFILKIRKKHDFHQIFEVFRKNGSFFLKIALILVKNLHFFSKNHNFQRFFEVFPNKNLYFHYLPDKNSKFDSFPSSLPFSSSSEESEKWAKRSRSPSGNEQESSPAPLDSSQKSGLDYFKILENFRESHMAAATAAGIQTNGGEKLFNLL